MFNAGRGKPPLRSPMTADSHFFPLFASASFPLYPRTAPDEAPMTNLRRSLSCLALLAIHLSVAGSSSAQDRSDNTLRKLNESVDALIKKVSPSVVQILV